MTRVELVRAFEDIFGHEGPVGTYFSPGRVNLIGEHTDYNGGHVFPCALTIGTYFAARKRTDNLIRFYSANFPEAGIIEREIDDLIYEESKGFSNYLMGMVWAFGERGMEIHEGMDIFIYGNIPNGSGLSSSASVEIGMGVILCDLYGFKVDMIELAKIAQHSENEFNGVNCGIMDQFAIAMGKKDNAIFLDTATLDYSYAPFILEGAKIIIACSNKKRLLGESKYNERRSQCEQALADLQKVIRIDSLGELNEALFLQHQDAITDPVCRKRAKHAVFENQRTIQAVQLLEDGDLEGFGLLMNESHTSLRDDYEVTGIELDTLVEEAWKIEGVIGSRMTGAGFGGCTVSIVVDDAVDQFITEVGQAYEDKIGYAADFYVVTVGGGAGILK